MESTYRYSEEAFINAVLHHDPIAFSDLYDHYANFVYALIRKLISDDLIRDQLFVDVFNIIWTAGHTYYPANETSFVWVFRITIHVCFEKLLTLYPTRPLPTVENLTRLLFNGASGEDLSSTDN